MQTPLWIAGTRCVGLVGLVTAVLVLPVVQADGDAVAVVNGEPVTQMRLREVLKEAHGLSILQQLIALELAKSETERLGIRVTDADVQREFEQALDRIAPEVDASGQALGNQEKRQVLDGILRERNLTLVEFMIGMERNAHLRKIVERDFQVNDATLREEFARVYGTKVEVRHVQVNNADALNQAFDLLAQGVPFEEVARRVSQNADTAANGGLLPPFTFKDEDVAPVLREAAFSLREGEISGAVRVGSWTHILKLERRIPPEDVRYMDVREKLERQMRNREAAEQMNQLLRVLFDKADIRVLDRDLKRKYERLMNESAQRKETLQP